MLVMSNVVGFVLRTDKNKPTLIGDIAILTARAKPGGVGKGQTLELEMMNRLMAFPLSFDPDTTDPSQ